MRLHLFYGQSTIRALFSHRPIGSRPNEGYMASTTLGVKVDDLLRTRLRDAATRLERTPHWLIKQAIFAYLERIERGQLPPELSGVSGAAEPGEGGGSNGDSDEDGAPHPFL